MSRRLLEILHDEFTLATGVRATPALFADLLRFRSDTETINEHVKLWMLERFAHFVDAVCPKGDSR